MKSKKIIKKVSFVLLVIVLVAMICLLRKFVNISKLQDNIYNVLSFLNTDNKWSTFLCSIPTSIVNAEYDGKSCYRIRNFNSPHYIYGMNINLIM